jgi:hypothetical protein
MDDLYQVYHSLGKDTRRRLGLTMKIPVFIKDPLVALENPELGIQEIDVRLEADISEGPTSSRIAVVDFNADTQQLTPPVGWDQKARRFSVPADQDQHIGVLPAATADLRSYLDEAIGNLQFHQINVWAVVQRVLEFYQEPQALGRAVPWGFDGNRLIVVPHAGYGENAFYDRHSKSLQFYYFGDAERPVYTCLSHDIIAHETGHAILDGIRPLYNQACSVQTPAFHEFIGDLTAIMLALFNKDIRDFVGRTAGADIHKADAVAEIARQFGQEVEGRPYLRTATNDLTLQQVEHSLSPHKISQVMTGAMFDILIAMAKQYMDRNSAKENAVAEASPKRQVTAYQALWWSADMWRRVALQPLDLCPPCDIQFVDYAKAVLLNDILTNPVDEDGYRQVMLEAFHKRGLCTCGYQADQVLSQACQFYDILDQSSRRSRMDFVYHDIERVSRSRTAAYDFLSDNRRVLRIPPHQDVVVVDLYDNIKLGAAAERLPREIVLEYLWQEEVTLTDDESKDLRFGDLSGKTMNLLCGGTLVFDGRGNLLSWFRKPGTEHITPARAQELRQKLKPTKQEMGELQDLEEGERRKAALLQFTARVARRGLVGESQPTKPVMEVIKPITAIEEGGVLRLEIAPHLRTSDLDREVEGWTVNY